MRPIYLCFLLLCGCFGALSQSSSQLLQSLEASPADSNRLNTLIRLSRMYYDINTDSGLLFSNEAIDLARRLKMPEKEAEGLKFKGDNFDVRGTYDSAELFFNQAMEIQQKRKDHKSVAGLLLRIGSLYEARSSYIEASNYFYRALAIGEKQGLVQVEAVAAANLALVQQHLANYAEAVTHYAKVLALFRSVNDTANMITALNNMASACSQPAFMRLDSAWQFANEAKGLAEKTENYRQLSTATNALAGIYYERKQYDSAILTYRQTIALAQMVNNPVGRAIALHYMAEMCRVAPDSVLRRQGIMPANKLDSALAFEEKALDILAAHEDVQRQGEAWQNMSAIYEAMNNYPAALAAFKKHKQFQDSVFNDEKKEALLQAKMQFDAEKKEETHRAELKKQTLIRNSAIAGGLGLLVIGGVIARQRNRRRAALQKQKEAELRSAIAETELRALRSQMNPHFIFNCLGSIADFIRKNDLDAADRYLNKFARLIRMVLESSGEKSIPLAEDLQALRLYLELEALRTNQAFSYQITVSDAIPQEETMIPPLILQPFVENSVWHGVAGMQGKGKIDIHISAKNDRLECRISDNGKGRKQAAFPGDPNKPKSFGTSITRDRLSLWQKAGAAPASLTINDLDTGTEVIVDIPLYDQAAINA